MPLPDYMGPTLTKHKILVGAMDPVPLCAQCPSAEWFVKTPKSDPSKRVSASKAWCFCTKFRAEVYNNIDDPITDCDAYVEAIISLKNKKER